MPERLLRNTECLCIFMYSFFCGCFIGFSSVGRQHPQPPPCVCAHAMHSWVGRRASQLPVFSIAGICSAHRDGPRVSWGVYTQWLLKALAFKVHKQRKLCAFYFFFSPSHIHELCTFKARDFLLQYYSKQFQGSWLLSIVCYARAEGLRCCNEGRLQLIVIMKCSHVTSPQINVACELLEMLLSLVKKSAAWIVISESYT